MNLINGSIILTFFNSKFSFWIGAFLLISPFAYGQPQINSRSINSSCLNRQINYTVMLPENYSNSNKAYPVIFLLHGIDGEGQDWIKRCHLGSIVDSLNDNSVIGEYIYVMPDAGNSYYVNNYNSSNMYMDYFISELIPNIDSLYRTSKRANDRALLGLSMGGFGAIILAVKNPKSFGAVSTMSAAVRNESIFISLPQSKYNYFFGSVFGPDLHGEKRITEHWKVNSPYTLMNSELADKLSELHWNIDCGTEDPLLPANEALHILLNEYNIPHKYQTHPGNHTWNYWNKSAIRSLKYLGSVLPNTSSR